MYTATIEPQAWQNDYANPVDPPGETTWDCSDFVKANPALRDEIDKGLAEEGEWIDTDDQLIGDQQKPAWVADWQGPFTITVDNQNPNED